MFPSSSLWIPIRFPRCSLGSQCVPQRCSQIAPPFNPTCFAQSPPLLTYIGGPKGEALHLFIQSSILGSLHEVQLFFCDGPIKLAHCKIKIKIGLVRHPQLINMKQNNKYPQFMGVTFEYSVRVQV